MKTIHLQNKFRGQNPRDQNPRDQGRSIKQRSLMQKKEKSEDRQYSLLCSICKSHTMVSGDKPTTYVHGAALSLQKLGIAPTQEVLAVPLMPGCQAGDQEGVQDSDSTPCFSLLSDPVLLVQAHALTAQACAAGIASRSHWSDAEAISSLGALMVVFSLPFHKLHWPTVITDRTVVWKSSLSIL